ncbi:hypothetical protein WJX81_006268 [Elliptochloris bilobata]|uniref:Protein kinase domain-containing protein n=1 Tax=Elliptochloris bilobata TaxID=381761 RepID=A0AAW1S6A5_9CHLO
MAAPGPAKAEPLLGHPKYRKVADLARGTFGFVQLAEDLTTGEHLAIKARFCQDRTPEFVPRGEKITKYVEREIINHKQLKHPHVVELREVFLTAEYLAIAMEYAAGGDMYHRVVHCRGLPEGDARWYFQQLVIAIDYCHRMGVANRDIKLENTLLDDSERPLLKICDFGYSKHEKYQSAPGSRVGTPAYLAPEVILTTKGKKYDGKSADTWACGVMLFIMLASAYPFGRPEDEQLKPSAKMHVMLQRILHTDYALPSHVRASPEFRDLLGRILVADPAARISLADIQRHPWFLAELPEGCQDMNARLLEEPPEPEVQSVEETEGIVREAMTAPAAAAAEAARPTLNFDNDDTLDTFMDEQRCPGGGGSSAVFVAEDEW